MMKFAALIAGLALAILGTACSPSLDSSEAVPTNQVSVKDNKFDARVIEVPAGTAVTWTWNGKQPHNVKGDGWGSETQEEGTFQHVFDTAGTYDYKCTLHWGMAGRVVVTP